MSTPIRPTFLWALALPLLALPLSAQAEHHPEPEHAEHHAEAHGEHGAERGSCPMLAEMKKEAMADVRADLERASQKLMALAEAIPADEYGWAPSDEVRTVSELFVHVAGANTFIPAAIGAPPREDVEISGSPFETMQAWEKEITEKDEVIAGLKSSFEYVQDALEALGSMDMSETLDVFGPMSRRSYVLVVLTHTHEHLGQAIAYARSLGVTPPWSQPAPAAGEG